MERVMAVRSCTVFDEAKFLSYLEKDKSADAYKIIEQSALDNSEKDEKLKLLINHLCVKFQEHLEMLEYCEKFIASENRIEMRRWVIINRPDLVVSKVGLTEIHNLLNCEQNATKRKIGLHHLEQWLKANLAAASSSAEQVH